MIIGVAQADPPATAAARDLAELDLASLADLIELAAGPSSSKSSRGLCPGRPAGPRDRSHKINRYRANLRDAEVLCFDLDGCPAVAWACLLDVLRDYDHAWCDSWSHAARSQARPGHVWRHVFLRLARPVSSAEYAATWTALADQVVPIGVELDASKRQIEDVIYLGTADGQGERSHSPGEPWPVTEPAVVIPIRRQRATQSQSIEDRSTRARAYAGAIPDPQSEPEFCSALTKIKRACSSEAEYRELAQVLASRSVSARGNPLTDSAHQRETAAKIDSVAANDQIVYASLEDRPQPDPIDVWRSARADDAPSSASSDGPIDVTDPGLAVRPLLERLSADPIIYRQDRQIVMVDGDTIVPVRSATLRGYASRKIGFVKTTKKGKIAGAGFAREVCEVAIESDLIPSTIREIKRVTTDPVPLLVDGRFELSTPGYHDGLLHVDGGLDVDRAEPSRARAERGYALLADLFADWPIVDQPSLASAIALAVSLVARHLITGPCPAWVASSNIRGSGKGLLLRTISMIATGRATAETVLAEGRDEQGKQVVAAFRSQQPMILFDEIKSLRQIHELDSIVTAYPSYSSRTLGKSEMVELPATPIWCVAGNNVSVEADSVRRVVAIRLESAVARPEEREDFRHANIVDHVTANRQAYYQALIDLIGYSLTIDDAYRVRAMGSFEAWSRLIRRPLVQIGGADPLDSRASLGIDVIEHDRAKVLIDLLAEHGPCKAESLHRFAAELEMVGIDPKRVAYALRRERGVIVDGLQITYTPGEFPWAATTPRRAVSPRMPEPDPESDPEPDPALVSRAAIQPSPRPWGSMVDPAIEARGGPGSIAIIDGTGTICRGYFADPGSAVGGLHLLAREIQALRWAGLERIVVCLDSRSRTRDHRREASDGYKANRDGREKPEGLLAQLGLASQSCRALGVHVDSDPGVEADDLIAYYALLGVPEGLTKITIVSIDKDLEQLAHDGPCSVATLNKGQVLGPAEIEAKRGVPVRHLGTYLSLVGDASDGVRGVDGVGPKTAIRLIAEHGSLERILAAADQIGGAVGRALVTCADQARLARELVQLRPDLCSPRTMPGPDPVSPIDKAWLDQYGLEA